MSQPAARVGDMHTCPMSDGPKPHVGGPISTGDPTVIICGQPTARVGDKATCIGPPDAIAQGAPAVLIGGKPAARLGDKTIHGGVIITGCTTVLIGSRIIGIPVPVPANANSIACQNEQLVVQNNNSGPDRACTQAHEEQHIRDWKERYGEDLCKGVSNGHQPVGGGVDYDEFLRQSECRAYRIGKACRQNLLRTAPNTDKPAIQRGIGRDDRMLRDYSCN